MKVGHITILTKDINKSIEFYTLLGGRKISEDILNLENGGTEHIVHMEFDSDVTIELINPSYKNIDITDKAPLEHFCFEVENLDELVYNLKLKGINTFIDDEPHNEPLFKAEGIRVIFLNGPSGESIELMQWI